MCNETRRWRLCEQKKIKLKKRFPNRHSEHILVLVHTWAFWKLPFKCQKLPKEIFTKNRQKLSFFKKTFNFSEKRQFCRFEKKCQVFFFFYFQIPILRKVRFTRTALSNSNTQLRASLITYNITLCIYIDYYWYFWGFLRSVREYGVTWSPAK